MVLKRINSTAGIILVGGKSRRMGSDKVEMMLGSKKVLSIILEELQEYCSEIIFAGRKIEGKHFKIKVPWKWVKDVVPERGPLAGVVSAMKVSGCENFIIVPCDMPFLTSRLFRIFLKNSENNDAVLPPHRGFPVLLNIKLLQCLEQNLKREELCFFDVIESCSERIKFLSSEEVENIGRLDIIFANVNTPEDLQFAEQIYSVMWR